MDTRLGTPFTPCLKDFSQTVVDIPVDITVFLSSSGMVATWPNLGHHLFGSTSVNF